MLSIVLVGHVLGAIGVGPIFTLPFLTNAPAALQRVLLLLRLGAVVTLVTGIVLWVIVKPAHPIWLSLSVALYVVVIATIAAVLEPAAKRLFAEPRMRVRVRTAALVSSVLTLCIGALMVLRKGEA